jgi:uncharacterized protein YodC (DUF2158 family)
MAGARFEVGDVVMLKSGGQAATVTKIEKTEVTVTYFSEPAGEFKTAVLLAGILEVVDFSDDDVEDE